MFVKNSLGFSGRRGDFLIKVTEGGQPRRFPARAGQELELQSREDTRSPFQDPVEGQIKNHDLSKQNIKIVAFNSKS